MIHPMQKSLQKKKFEAVKPKVRFLLEKSTCRESFNEVPHLQNRKIFCDFFSDGI